ncbi:STT3 domain-containing protein [Nanoarchaeota archaeon]
MAAKASSLEPYLKRRHIFYLAIILIIGAIIFSQTARLPVTDDIAEEIIKSSMMQELAPMISAEQPFLPSEQKQKLLEDLINEQKDSSDYKEAVALLSKELKEYYQDTNGVTYLFNYDPYFYLRQAENLLQKGTLGEYEKEGRPYDDLRHAPSETKVFFSIVPYIIVATNYITGTVPGGAFWMPVAFGLLCILLAFLLGWVIFNEDVGFITGLILAIHPAAFETFKGGAADTPPLNLFWSLCIILLYFLALKSIEEKKYRNTGITISAIILCTFLFKLTWTGYYYILALVLVHAALYAIIKVWNSDTRHKKTILGAICVAGLAAFILFMRSSYYTRILSRLNLVEISGFFPSGLSTVSELQGMTLSGLYSLYVPGLLLFAVIGIIFLLLTQKKQLDHKSFILVWTLLVLLPLLSNRFYIYGLPALALLAGIGITKTSEYIDKLQLDIPIKNPVWGILILGILVLTLVPTTIRLANAYPYMDDSIHDAAQDIRTYTEPNTIINTWWDYGYIYEYYARRPATFDGGELDPQRLYWMSKALLGDEDNAIGILRMMNCGGENIAFSTLSDKLGRLAAVDALEAVLKMDKENASSYYESQGVPDLTNMTHCDTDSVLVLSSDMLKKIHNMNYFANWDFANQVSFSTPLKLQKGDCIGNRCSGQVTFNQTESWIQGLHPQKFIYVSRDFSNVSVLDYPDGEAVIIIVIEDDMYLMDPGLEESLLVKGLFLGLDNWELLTLKDQRKRIVAYKMKQTFK